MINKNLCIVNSKTLYEIFFEFKNDFPYNIIFKKSENLDKNDYVSNNTIYLIDKEDTELFKKFQFSQIFALKNLPFKIDDFITRMNIQFLRTNFLNKSNIKSKDYSLDLNSKIISKKNKQLKLT